MSSDWITGRWHEALGVPLSLLLLYAIVIVAHRVVGLRSFAKMSGADFVTTVAVGSLLGTAIAVPDPSVALAGAALVGLFLLMLLSAWLRRHAPALGRHLDNQPIYLMDGPEVLAENLDRANVTIGDLHNKLREAGVWNYGQVVAVVFEQTGDVSVLSRPGDGLPPEPRIFADVRGRASAAQGSVAKTH